MELKFLQIAAFQGGGEENRDSPQRCRAKLTVGGEASLEPGSALEHPIRQADRQGRDRQNG